MRLSKQTSDAIQILCHCYRQDDNLSKVGNIAQALGFTKQMTFKLVKILNQSGFIETARGPHGGIKISEMAKTATVGAIVRELEKKPIIKQAEQDTALLNVYIDEAFEAFLEVLDQHALADMVTCGKTADSPENREKSERKEMPASIYDVRFEQRTTPA